MTRAWWAKLSGGGKSLLLGLAAVLVVTAVLWRWDPDGGLRDGCGHDLSDKRSTVVALRPEDGSVVWTRVLPAVAPWPRYDPAAGEIRVPQVGSPAWFRLDVGSGERLGEFTTDEPIMHEPNAVAPGSAPFVVEAHYEDGGWVHATDAVTGAEWWRVKPPRDGGFSVLQLEHVAIVASTDDLPTCY